MVAYQQSKSATLTFKIHVGAWFVRETRRLDMLNTCAQFYLKKVISCIRELQPGHEIMHINTETMSVTLTVEIGAWFFLATRNLDRKDSGAYKVTAKLMFLLNIVLTIQIN